MGRRLPDGCVAKVRSEAALAIEVEPMYRLLTEPKRLEVYEGGHVAPQEISIPVFTKWFDETLGPVGYAR